jgi:hypothetical protein
MSNVQIVLFVAYSFGFIGSVLIFCYGVPRIDINFDGSEGIDASLGEEKERLNRIKWLNYDRLSHLGITLIGVSFILQIISLWITK